MKKGTRVINTPKGQKTINRPIYNENKMKQMLEGMSKMDIISWCVEKIEDLEKRIENLEK